MGVNGAGSHFQESGPSLVYFLKQWVALVRPGLLAKRFTPQGDGATGLSKILLDAGGRQGRHVLRVYDAQLP